LLNKKEKRDKKRTQRDDISDAEREDTFIDAMKHARQKYHK
jgi:hypothetical protein